MPEAPKQIDLASQGLVIVEGLTIATDPKDEIGKKTARKTPANSGRTQDDHRFTVAAPTPDETVFSVGKGATGPIAKTGLQHIKDTGITGRTKSHVHFETTGKPKTIVTLGGPTQDGTVPNVHGDHLISKVSGYAMITAGDAWHESVGQHYVMSSEADVTLRARKAGKYVRIQADGGSVEAIGGRTAMVASPGSVLVAADETAAVSDCGYRGNWTAKTLEAVAGKLGSSFLSVMDVAKSLHSWGTGLSKMVKLPNEGGPGWTTEADRFAPKIVIDAAKIVSSVSRYLDGWSKPDGRVGLLASRYASITGLLSASMYGNLSSKVSSLVSASVLGGVSASLKALGWASIEGLGGVSVKSKQTIGMSGKVLRFNSKDSTTVSSENGTVLLSGEWGAQLHSPSGWIASHGKKSAFVGTGNFGILATNDTLEMGVVTSVDDFQSPKIDFGNSIHFSKGGLYLKRGNCAIEMNEQGRLDIYAKSGSKFTLDDTLRIKAVERLMLD